MQSIGERIEEARKRKGISLREAAEATKVRSDFLANIEQNKFDFDLPDIYKRGFLKNYARYLKLDPDKIIAEYNAQQLTKARSSRRGSAELFGSMEPKTETEESTSRLRGRESDQSNLGRIAPRHRSSSADDEEDVELDEESDKIFYLKAGAACVAILTIIIIVFGLVQAILGTDSPQAAASNEDNPTLSPSSVDDAANNSGSITSRDGSEEVKLVASGIVYVIARQKNDGAELYRGTLSTNETVTLQKTGPLDIVFTVAENLIIEHGGERLKPSGSGNAKITLR